MLWRIGDILPIMEQMEWCRKAGFDGIGLHASPGRADAWEGVDPASADRAKRGKLREAIARFTLCEVHAPFEIVLEEHSLTDAVRRLEPVTAFARDIGARIVTVHAELPAPGRRNPDKWTDSMAALNADAGEKNLNIGLEIVSGFDAVQGWELSNIGITLDVGHMYHVDGGKPLEPFGSIGELVRQIDEILMHLHLHDVACVDHVEPGTGRVDFRDLLTALRDIGYAKGICLELNPDRVSADGIRRSLAWLREESRTSGES